MAGYWIDPNGKVYDIPHFMHEKFARSKGASGVRDLLSRGWVRAILHEGAFNISLWSYSDERAVENVEDFVLRKGRHFERFMVFIETENATDPKLTVRDKDIMDLGFKDALAHEIKLKRISPPGLKFFVSLFVVGGFALFGFIKTLKSRQEDQDIAA